MPDEQREPRDGDSSGVPSEEELGEAFDQLCRRNALQAFTDTIAVARDAAACSELLGPDNAHATNLASELASRQLNELKQSAPSAIKWEAMPTADQLAPGINANLNDGLRIASVVVLYVAIDELLNYLIGELRKRFSEEILRRCEGKTVGLGSLRAKGVAVVEQETISEWTNREQEKSITAKLRTLYAITSAPSGVALPTLEEIERIRNIRHEAAHRSISFIRLVDLPEIFKRVSLSYYLLYIWVTECIDGDHRVFDIDGLIAAGLYKPPSPATSNPG